MNKINQRGQAVLEYMVVFAFLALISIAMTKALGGFMGNTAGSMGYQLSNHLSAGVCPNNCFDNSFINKLDGAGAP